MLEVSDFFPGMVLSFDWFLLDASGAPMGTTGPGGEEMAFGTLSIFTEFAEGTFSRAQPPATTLVFQTTFDETGTHRVDIPGTDAQTTITITGDGGDQGPPPVPGQENRPQDLDDDGLYENVTGGGDFSIQDVQVFFDVRDSDPVQNNAQSFNFDEEEPPDITVRDVQAHFQLFQNQE